MTKIIRERAMNAFRAGLAAADPTHAMQLALANHPLPAPKNDGTRFIIAFGKAAVAMAKSVLENQGGIKTEILVVTNYENAVEMPRVEVIASGHPIPDQNGLMASEKIAKMMRSAGADDVVVALISGGGSALLPAPVGELTLEEKMRVNDLLLKNNLEITQMNLVRQNLSYLKGGKLTELAAPAPITSYILSDVIGDDLNVVASGPTAQAIGPASEARALLQERDLWELLPTTAKTILESPSPARVQGVNAQNHLIGSNSNSAQAMAREINATYIGAPLVGEVGEAIQTCLVRIEQEDKSKPIALVWGGETTVEVKGTGKGGRNQELAIRFALEASKAGLDGDWCFLSGASDGRDGPTDAAGGLVGPGTLGRLQKAGGNLAALLENNDSYQALSLAGDLIKIGATGTNVADLQVFIRNP